MNNLCPNCKIAYSVQPQHVGRRITCRKCGAGLVVEEDGLHMASPPLPPEPPGEDPRAVEAPPLVEELPPRIGRPRPAWNPLATLAGFVQARGEELGTGLFAAGTFCVILFVFLPVIDQAKVARAQVRVREEGGFPDGAV